MKKTEDNKKKESFINVAGKDNNTSLIAWTLDRVGNIMSRIFGNRKLIGFLLLVMGLYYFSFLITGLGFIRSIRILVITIGTSLFNIITLITNNIPLIFNDLVTPDYILAMPYQSSYIIFILAALWINLFFYIWIGLLISVVLKYKPNDESVSLWGSIMNFLTWKATSQQLTEVLFSLLEVKRWYLLGLLGFLTFVVWWVWEIESNDIYFITQQRQQEIQDDKEELKDERLTNNNKIAAWSTINEIDLERYDFLVKNDILLADLSNLKNFNPINISGNKESIVERSILSAIIVGQTDMKQYYKEKGYDGFELEKNDSTNPYIIWINLYIKENSNLEPLSKGDYVLADNIINGNIPKTPEEYNNMIDSSLGDFWKWLTRNVLKKWFKNEEKVILSPYSLKGLENIINGSHIHRIEQEVSVQSNYDSLLTNYFSNYYYSKLIGWVHSDNNYFLMKSLMQEIQESDISVEEIPSYIESFQNTQDFFQIFLAYLLIVFLALDKRLVYLIRYPYHSNDNKDNNEKK